MSHYQLIVRCEVEAENVEAAMSQVLDAMPKGFSWRVLEINKNLDNRWLGMIPPFLAEALEGGTMEEVEAAQRQLAALERRAKIRSI